MMQAIIDMFDKRCQEIDTYFHAMEELEKERDEQRDADDEHLGSHVYINDEFLKVLKANSLLMIYNLVESTVMGGILEIYDRVRQDGLAYADVKKEIQDVWFSYKFHQVYDPKAHYNSYKAKAREIVNAILIGDIIELDRKAIPISGNLDAQKIRNICQNHGISFDTDDKCHGGSVLEAVREKRNNLAHGTLSFAECGRDYSLEDLETIKSEATLFLQGLLNGMKQYYDNKSYKV